MKQATGKQLAKDLAKFPFHGAAEGLEPDLQQLVRHFPGWTAEEADGHRFFRGDRVG